MTPKPQPPPVARLDNPAIRVRERIRRWLDLTGLPQHEFAKAAGGKSQVWLQQILKGKNEVRLAALDDVARAMRTTACELVRSADELYTLELTPTEVRIIEQLRRHPETFAGISLLLHVPAPERPKPQEIPARPRLRTSRRNDDTS